MCDRERERERERKKNLPLYAKPSKHCCRLQRRDYRHKNMLLLDQTLYRKDIEPLYHYFMYSQ